LHMLGMYGKKASMERQNSNGLIKNFKRECQSKNVSKALRITVGYMKSSLTTNAETRHYTYIGYFLYSVLCTGTVNTVQSLLIVLT